MECPEMFARLSEFLDGELPAGLCEEIRQHVEGCAPCSRFCASLRETVDLCRHAPPVPIPEDVRRDLRALLDRMRRT